MSEFTRQLATVQEAREDFEWYPTTQEIIDALKRDISLLYGADHYRRDADSFLDIGAGNGKVLSAVADLQCGHQLYAIEKSHALMEMLPKDVYVLGCDFWNTALYDKEIGVIFSNPPYSQFVEWSVKIITEAFFRSTIYLVIPERWENSPEIGEALKSRQATTKVIGSFDFLSAEDRAARAKVHLLRIRFEDWAHRFTDNDPFVQFFNRTFTFAQEEQDGRSFEEKIEETRVVHRLNFIEALCRLYDLRMEELQRNYQAICDITPSILQEFDIRKDGLIKSLKMKLATAKKEYWQRLFDGMKEIECRLTKNSRTRMCSMMQQQTGIDFNRDNAYAVVLWVLKNANSYFDEQLVETYERLVDFANIENYASNKRVFQTDRFRYEWMRSEDASHYRLKVGNRIVLDRCGGLAAHPYNSSRNGLSSSAADFIGDLLVVANNLGFSVVDPAPREGEWSDSEGHIFRIRNEGKEESLFRVRAFYNGNMHFQFHPDFIHALNVQHGKLKGWLRGDAQQAAEELEIPQETAARFMMPGFRFIGLNSVPALTVGRGAA